MWKLEIEGIEIGKLATIWETSKYTKIAHVLLNTKLSKFRTNQLSKLICEYIMKNNSNKVSKITKLIICEHNYYNIFDFTNLEYLELTGIDELKINRFDLFKNLKVLRISVDYINETIVLPESIIDAYIYLESVGGFEINFQFCVNLKRLVLDGVFYQNSEIPHTILPALEYLHCNFQNYGDGFSMLFANINCFKLLKYLKVEQTFGFDASQLLTLPNLEEVYLHDVAVKNLPDLALLSLKKLTLIDIDLDSYEFPKEADIKIILIR